MADTAPDTVSGDRRRAGPGPLAAPGAGRRIRVAAPHEVPARPGHRTRPRPESGRGTMRGAAEGFSHRRRSAERADG